MHLRAEGLQNASFMKKHCCLFIFSSCYSYKSPLKKKSNAMHLKYILIYCKRKGQKNKVGFLCFPKSKPGNTTFLLMMFTILLSVLSITPKGCCGYFLKVSAC